MPDLGKRICLSRIVRVPVRLGWLLAWILCLVLSLASVPSTDAQDRPRSRLEADRFIDRVIDGEPVSCMIGNVFIDRDTLTARSDSAYFYREREVYEFEGNVRLTQHAVVLTCDRAVYEKNLGDGDFFGKVRLVEGDVIGTGRRGESRGEGRFLYLIGDALLVTPDYSVRADTIYQDRETGEGQAFGHVRIMEPGAQNLVTGDHAVFSGDGRIAEVDQNPVLTSRQERGGLLTSTAELMRFYRWEDRVVMTDSVRIRQGMTRAKADTAIAYGQERLVLTGAPELELGGKNRMLGDEITFYYLGGEIRQVTLVGAARMEDTSPDSLAAIYDGLPSMDVLEGDSVAIDFENEEIRRSVVVGQAHSIYTPLDLEGEVSTNDVRGDTIILHFRDKEVRRVNVLGSAEGFYKFARIEDMEQMRGQSRRLADMLSAAGGDSLALADSLGSLPADSLWNSLPDSLKTAALDSLSRVTGLPRAGADALLAAALDSLATAGFDTSKSSLDFLTVAQGVRYAGRVVNFEMADRTMEIMDQGELEYGSMKLTADHIKMDTDERELYADGQPMVEDADTIVGEQMGYNFKHKTAAVQTGVTVMDDYYYSGSNIRRYPDQTMKICGGRMTSCDREESHYHFWSKNMKMRPEDKVVAAPVVLKVGNVPIFALPFYYKSLKEGRQSGILFPSFDFGWSSREGRYIRDFGYYWATNEYMDFIFEGDYNENREFAYRISNRYVRRYTFNGGIDYSRKIGLGDGDKVDEWQLRWNHNQPTLMDDYKFRADVKLASTSLTSNDLTGSSDRDIVSGQLKSNVFVSRNWSFLGANLSATRDERVNASDDDPVTNNLIYSMTLPSFSLNFKQITLAPSLRSGQKGSAVGNMLRNTYFQQGYSFNSESRGYEEREDTDYRASGNWSLSLRPPRVSIFNVSFSANAQQAWTRASSDGRVWIDSTGVYEDFSEVEETTLPGLSFSAGLGTTLYGLFPIQVGRMRALRHTWRLNSNWSLRPGLGSKQAHGTSIGLSMGNRFDLKYLGADSDSTMAEKKLDGLIDWSLSTAFNPKLEPGKQWNDISSGLTIKPGQAQYLRLKVSNTIDPNSWALKSTRFTYGLNFNGKLDMGEVAQPPEARKNESMERLGPLVSAEEDSLAADQSEDVYDRDGNLVDAYGQDELFDGEESSFYDFYNKQGRQEGGLAKDPTEGGRFIPFDVSASLSYSYTNGSDTKRASSNVSLRTNLTRNWEFRYQASFDLVEGIAIRQQYSLHRDLHCWRVEFNRTISNVDSQFGFRFYLISIPSLKLARGREDSMGSLSGGLGAGAF